MRIAVTGASGFVGRATVHCLLDRGHQVRAISRHGDFVVDGAEPFASGDLLIASLPPLVERCDAVVHCAARVHVTKRERPSDAIKAYKAMNVDLPLRLAECAKSAGVKRFVQLSSVAAMGAAASNAIFMNDDAAPAPTTLYGSSKLKADEGLMQLSDHTMSVISIRPPAVYGPGVGAWFALLRKAARYGLPLPIGRFDNQRSFIFVDNLADAIAHATQSKTQGSYIVTDSEPMSIKELYARMLERFGYGRRIWDWPRPLVETVAQAFLGDRASSLLGSACYDGRRFVQELGWTSPISQDQAIAQTLNC